MTLWPKSLIRNGMVTFYILLTLSSCTTHRQQFTEAEQFLLAGDPEQALKVLNASGIRRRDPALYYLDRSMMQRIAGEYQSSNKSLRRALQKIEAVHAASVSENILSLVINEAQISFRGTSFEQVMIHLIMALNYLDMKQLDAARVEAQRLDIKLKEVKIADDYDHYQEDAFARYLTGMIYEALDEPDNALIAFRKAHHTYVTQQPKFGVKIPNFLKQDLLRLSQKLGIDNEFNQWQQQFNLAPSDVSDHDGQVIVLVAEGLAPVKIEVSANHFNPYNNTFFRLALPKYVSRPIRLHEFQLSANHYQVGSEPVQDIDAIARYMLNAQQPVLLARAVTRQLAKNKLATNVKKENKLIGDIIQLTSLLNERADTRAWTTLPSGYLMSRLFLPAASYTINLTLYGHHLSLGQHQVEASKTLFLTHHWLSPKLRIKRR